MFIILIIIIGFEIIQDYSLGITPGTLPGKTWEMSEMSDQPFMPSTNSSTFAPSLLFPPLFHKIVA